MKIMIRSFAEQSEEIVIPDGIDVEVRKYDTEGLGGREILEIIQLVIDVTANIAVIVTFIMDIIKSRQNSHITIDGKEVGKESTSEEIEKLLKEIKQE